MSKVQPHFRVRNVIVCDDIRMESNGKQLLIGVYTIDILVASFPARMRLSFWIDVDQSEPGNIPFEIRGLFSDKPDPVFNIKGSLGAIEPIPYAQIGLHGIPIEFKEQDSMLKLELRQYAEKWEEIRSIKIRKRPEASSSEPQPPSEQFPPAAQN